MPLGFPFMFMFFFLSLLPFPFLFPFWSSGNNLSHTNLQYLSHRFTSCHPDASSDLFFKDFAAPALKGYTHCQRGFCLRPYSVFSSDGIHSQVETTCVSSFKVDWLTARVAVRSVETVSRFIVSVNGMLREKKRELSSENSNSTTRSTANKFRVSIGCNQHCGRTWSQQKNTKSQH